MRGNIAIVREALSKLPNVSRTWFEWSWEDAMWVKTLVIEVEFDTDPNSPKLQPAHLGRDRKDGDRRVERRHHDDRQLPANRSQGATINSLEPASRCRLPKDRRARRVGPEATPPLPVGRAQMCSLARLARFGAVRRKDRASGALLRPAPARDRRPSARPQSPERGWRRFEPAFDPAEAVSLDRVAGRVYRLIERRGPCVPAIEARNESLEVGDE